MNFLIFTLTNCEIKSQILGFGLLVLFLFQALGTLFFLQITIVFTLFENLRNFIVFSLLNVLPNNSPTDTISLGAE